MASAQLNGNIRHGKSGGRGTINAVDAERAERLRTRNRRRFKRFIAYAGVETVIGIVVLSTGPVEIGLFLLGVGVFMIGVAYYMRWFTTWLVRKTEEGQARRASSN